MKVGVRYIVTKSSDDETFEVGDHITLAEDGSINCREAQGWIDALDVEEATKGMEFEIDKVWYETKKSNLLKELELLNNI